MSIPSCLATGVPKRYSSPDCYGPAKSLCHMQDPPSIPRPTHPSLFTCMRRTRAHALARMRTSARARGARASYQDGRAHATTSAGGGGDGWSNRARRSVPPDPPQEYFGWRAAAAAAVAAAKTAAAAVCLASFSQIVGRLSVPTPSHYPSTSPSNSPSTSQNPSLVRAPSFSSTPSHRFFIGPRGARVQGRHGHWPSASSRGRGSSSGSAPSQTPSAGRSR